MSQGPSYEELAALVAVQARVIDELRAEVAELRAGNAELKRRLRMDSTNSRTSGSARSTTRSASTSKPSTGWP
ncbi:hypothetical protein [Streptomyces spongiae]|uniref:hypothetical protein n=1 Tax=Streptomyces spongiae TaxID=565072 RepID=UPI00188396AD|nr:hypothetical protein [Streptomyces spongiae]